MDRLSIKIAVIIFSALLATAAAAADFGFETGDPQQLSLVASVHLHNAGLEPIRNVGVRMFMPSNIVGQRMFAVDCVPEPNDIEIDQWTQHTARWDIPKIEPGEHVFVMWVVQAASMDVRYDIDRLRRGDYLLPVPVRLLYLRGAGHVVDSRQSLVDLCLDLAGYVRRNLTSEITGVPPPQAIPRIEDAYSEAVAYTRLAHANGIPCRTVSGYVRGLTGTFSIDFGGRAWNEVYFPQSGWVPLAVGEPRDFGRKRNDIVVVRMSGHSSGPQEPFWGSVTGATDDLRIVHRGYFSRPHSVQQDREFIAAFAALHGSTNESAIIQQLEALGPGHGLALGLIEPYLHHSNLKIAEKAVEAIGAIRQERAVVMLADAMGRSPELDAQILAVAGNLAGNEFSSRLALRRWIRERVMPGINR